MDIIERLFGRYRSDVTQSRRAIKDVILSLVPQSARSGAGFITAVLLARGLGPAGMGQYALVTSLTDTIGSLSDLGIGQIALRYASSAAARDDRKTLVSVLRWAFRVRLVLVVGLSLILLALAPVLADIVWKSPGLSPVISMAVLIPVFMAIAAVPIIYFQALRRFGMNAVIHVGQASLVILGVGMLALLNIWSVFLAITVIACATAVGSIVFLVAVPRDIVFAPDRTGNHDDGTSWWRPRFRTKDGLEEPNAESSEQFALFMLLATVIVMITLKLDVWMMGVYLDQSQIGIYAVASRFTVPLVIILGAVNTALWPRSSSASTREEIRLLGRKTARAGLLLAIMGIVYAFTVPLCTTFVFGERYASSASLATILCIGHALAFLANPVAVVGYALGLARLYWITNIAQLVLVAVMLSLLLPTYGATGAALTFVASTLLGGLVNGLLVWKRLHAVT
jgi:O-antigen/teichoic acid export membrane protein